MKRSPEALTLRRDAPDFAQRCRPSLRNMMPKSFIPVIFMVLAGCQQARSFLHMDSNSSSPFLGWELSVDADHRYHLNEPSSRRNLPALSLVGASDLSGTELRPRPATTGLIGNAIHYKTREASVIGVAYRGANEAIVMKSLRT